MEERKLTQEELIEADAFFNLASLLGRSILAAAYQIMHPEYNPSQELYPDGATVEFKPEPLKGKGDGYKINSNEANVDSQIDQMTALYIPEIYRILRPSALFELFLYASEQFSFDEDSLREDILTPVDKRKAAIAWIIAKRVFAVRHPDETVRILSITESILDAPKMHIEPFRPADQSDFEMVSEACSLFFQDEQQTDEAIDQQQKALMAEKLDQLKNSSVISSPTSLAFWRQSEAAALGISKKTGEKKTLTIPDVYSKPVPAGVDLTISNAEGKPVEINAFDMAIQATIGQMIRENEGKPVQATPAQVFRKCAGLDPSASVSPASIKSTTESIEKMRKADAVISYEQQLEAFLKKNKQSKQPGFNYSIKKIEGELVSADLIQVACVSPNGRITEAVYNFLRAPILVHYSYGFKQLMEVDKKYLAGALNKATPDNIGFARYILVQINRMKSDKGKKKIPDDKPYSEALTFETIAARCVYDISTRGKLRNFQDKVFAYCMNLVTRDPREPKLVKHVDKYYKGKEYVGIIISV